MTEDEARAWLARTFDNWPCVGMTFMTFDACLRAEARHQNLIAASTLDALWGRHFADSAQLVPLAADAPPGPWIDLGSGAGLPGLVVALLTARPVVLIEERRKRADFLEQMLDRLELRSSASVHAGKVERYRGPPAAVISARAFAPLPRLFELALPLSTEKTLWVLPKGRNARSELEQARIAWQGAFHVKQSVTDPDSSIIIATGVRRKASR